MSTSTGGDVLGASTMTWIHCFTESQFVPEQILLRIDERVGAYIEKFKKLGHILDTVHEVRCTPKSELKKFEKHIRIQGIIV